MTKSKNSTGARLQKALPWHAEALRLRALGMNKEAIAVEVGKSATQVRRLIGPDGHSHKHLGPTKVVVGYKPRAINRIIARPDDYMAAVRAFAAGKITRETMMRAVSRPPEP